MHVSLYRAEGCGLYNNDDAVFGPIKTNLSNKTISLFDPFSAFSNIHMATQHNIAIDPNRDHC